MASVCMRCHLLHWTPLQPCMPCPLFQTLRVLYNRLFTTAIGIESGFLYAWSGELSAVPLRRLEAVCGQADALWLHRLSRGIDDEEVTFLKLS